MSYELSLFRFTVGRLGWIRNPQTYWVSGWRHLAGPLWWSDDDADE